MIGLLVIMEFKQWTADEAGEAYSPDAGIQFALNLPRDHQYLCPRTVENYQRLLREHLRHRHRRPCAGIPDRHQPAAS